jgi:hypothetical protein
MKVFREAPPARMAIIQTHEGARLVDTATDERRLNELRAVNAYGHRLWDELDARDAAIKANHG